MHTGLLGSSCQPSARSCILKISRVRHAHVLAPQAARYRTILLFAKPESQCKEVPMLIILYSCVLLDPAQALSFLQNLLKEVDTPTTREAYLLCLCESAHFSLLQGDLPTVTTSLTKAQKELESIDNIPSNVYSSFYRVSGDLAKSKADYVGYYKNSLLYLACLDISNLQKSLNKEERVNRSRDLGIAALLGETIYNFGELLMHPIIIDLKESEYSWLYELLLAFNAGSLGKFESLLPYVQQEVSTRFPAFAFTLPAASLRRKKVHTTNVINVAIHYSPFLHQALIS